jgi:hypothetical protein
MRELSRFESSIRHAIAGTGNTRAGGEIGWLLTEHLPDSMLVRWGAPGVAKRSIPFTRPRGHSVRRDDGRTPRSPPQSMPNASTPAWWEKDCNAALHQKGQRPFRRPSQPGCSIFVLIDHTVSDRSV